MKKKSIKRFIPLGIIIILMLLAYFLGVGDLLSFEMLKETHMELADYVDMHPILTPLIFILVYILSTSLSIPGAVFLTLLGGYLFPQPLSTLYVVFAATIGATIIFLAAKTALGDTLKKRAGPLLKKMEKGFHENAVSYLLFLRFVPLFPFWLVNLAPAFFGVSLRTFFWTTFVGIIPGSFVFTQAGRGLAAIFETQNSLTLSGIFNMQVKIALICLGIFSLLPVIIKKFRKR